MADELRRCAWGSPPEICSPRREDKDSKEGKASFHSLRATFITRCEEHGIPRQVLQGIVGHKSPMMTELYSQDKESGKVLRTLPTFPEAPETEKND